MTLRLALIGGPMYDGLYSVLEGRDVEVVVHADHPSLNRAVAEMLAGGERIDVLSTHGKYAPSQARWLHPLDALLPDGAVEALAPGALELCRLDGALLSVPRLVDVRILWARADRLASVPDDWAGVVAAAEAGNGFGMPGRDSGLFGTFFELVVGAGGDFLDDGRSLDADVAVEAVRLLQRLAAAGPDSLPGWMYDDVDRALLDGVVDAAAAWPGATARIRASELPLVPAPYPRGAQRRVTYSGAHSWAIPVTCGDLEGAVDLVTELCGAEAHRRDAASGSICANREALLASDPVDEIDARRLELTRDAIEHQMITYPPLERFPEIEGPGADALHDALLGLVDAEEAVARIVQAIDGVVHPGDTTG